jgi:predicted RNA-binding Zn-ribbon protein involved in translation (DUF1610 family)
MATDRPAWTPVCDACGHVILSAIYDSADKAADHQEDCPNCGAMGPWSVFQGEEDRLRTLRDHPGPVNFQ